MERKVLGRGLEALIPQDGISNVRERVQMIHTDQIKASRFQPRLSFSQAKIEELAKSIKEKGVIQPVLLRSIENDQFELIAGERRLRATKFLGLTEIPAIVRRIADADLLETSIIENIQREELNAIEEAKAYQRLATEFGHTQESIATKVGKDKSSISNLLRILNLPQEVQDYISKNLISFGHARALLSLGDAKKQLRLCQNIVKKGLSVRQIENLGSRVSRSKSVRRSTQDTNIRDLEERLQHALGTKVVIRAGKKRGKIEIEYYSLDDLERVLKLLGVK